MKPEPDEIDGTPLTNRELDWLTLGRLLGILRYERLRDGIRVTPGGRFGDFFMRKCGLHWP